MLFLLKPISHIFCLILIVLGILGCDIRGQDPVNPDIKDVTIRDLYQSARTHQKIMIVDAWSDTSYHTKLRQLVDSYYHQHWKLSLKSHDQITQDELASGPVILVGQPETNQWLTEFHKQLPIKLKHDVITIGEDQFDSNSHGLSLSFYPNPMNTRMPLGIVTSGNEALLWDLINSKINILGRGDWGYEVLEGSNRVLLGNLSQFKQTRWEIDTSQQIRLPSKVVHHWNSPPFEFRSYHSELNEKSMDYLTIECERELMSILKFTGLSHLSDTIGYTVYPSTEIKGLMTGNTDQSHMDANSYEVYSAFDACYAGRYFGKENQLIISNLLGKSSYPVLEQGLGLYFSSNWQNQGYDYWANYLAQNDMVMTVAVLLDSGGEEHMSALCRQAFAGSLVEFLIEYWGRQQFLEKYSQWSPTAEELETLTKLWIEHLKDNTVNLSPLEKSAIPYLKGFNFTHEGYRIYNGYGSKLSEGSLEQVKRLGANAIAVVPYSWMRDPKKPSPFRFSNRPGSENDEGVIHALYEAKKRGMFTVLKPHVWLGDSWPGEVEMTSESDWELFFEYYYQWISHYALMAQMHQVDALCIGVEFSKATLGQEHRWRELIKKLRKIYRGNLTYAANWGEEFENITFWDQLDFIGLNCYYPLSENQDASVDELKQGFQQVLTKIEQVKTKYQLPVVLTEIGFRSVDAPWIYPHQEAGERQFNEEDQVKAYDAVLRATSENPVVDGMLWWKWPTNPVQQIEGDRRFIPVSKKAEKTLEYWFNHPEVTGVN